MYNQDPRFAYVNNGLSANGNSFNGHPGHFGYQTHFSNHAPYAYGAPTNWAGWNMGSPAPAVSAETILWCARIETQIAALNELVRRELGGRYSEQTQGGTYAQGPYAQGAHSSAAYSAYPQGVYPMNRHAHGYSSQETCPVKMREGDGQIHCDIFLPTLAVGDVEVEVNGNRVVCRTRVPVAPASRTYLASTQLPRGFDVFEIPDGRMEYSWICPVAFHPKEVEATFRDGFLSICVPKVETASTRHTVKVAKETITRRAASEMNS